MIVNPAHMTRKLVSLPHTLVAAIEDFRFANRIKTESEAVRRLIELGLSKAADHTPTLRSVGPESEVRGGSEAPENPEIETDD